MIKQVGNKSNYWICPLLGILFGYLINPNGNGLISYCYIKKEVADFLRLLNILLNVFIGINIGVYLGFYFRRKYLQQ